MNSITHKPIKVKTIDDIYTIISSSIEDTPNGKKITLINNTDNDIAIKEVEIKSGEFVGLSDDTMIYGEGYEMLSELYKKLKDVTPKDSTMSSTHYKLPQTTGKVTCYNFIYLEDDTFCRLYGASSSFSYVTEFRFDSKCFEIVQVLEGRKLPRNASLTLEYMVEIEGNDRNMVFDKFAKCINGNHKKRVYKEIPDGWCSWYCYGPMITEGAIYKNLKSAMKSNIKGIKYIQIDDGYQPHMGDWLLQTSKFRSQMKDICLKIRENGFEPAMWVAPFIASEKSSLFANHPDWFIKDNYGSPLCARDCTFKGWRDAPWYFLDLTHPDAKSYIKKVFSIMKNEWKVNYFKLDANAWGGLPFGVRYDNTLTSVEAYRQGMEDIWDAVGSDTFLLGCNAPLFPSIGVVSGMRITNDIARTFNCINGIAKQCFFRNWMHNNIWTNDPDCLVQKDLKFNIFKSKAKKEGMYRYAAAVIRASGGMVLSGDKLFMLNNYDKRIMNLLLESKRISATFNFDYSIGKIEYDNTTEYFFFNEKRHDTRNFVIKIDKGELRDNFADKVIENNGEINITVPKQDANWFTLVRK